MQRSEIRGHQVVCSALIEKDEKFLVVLCPRFQVWRVPGGRAEYGERLEDTLIREMKEETEIIFNDPKYLGFGQDQQFHVRGQKETSRLIMFYHVHTKDEPILDPDEALEHKWVTIDELFSMEDKEGALTDFFERFPEVKKLLQHDNT